MRRVLIVCVATLCLGFSICAPSLVLTTSPNSDSHGIKEGPEKEGESNELIIYEFDVNSNISNRFAKTLVTSKVKNPDVKAKEATFTVVLPEKAFISGFVMEIDGKSYKAYVKEKEEAKNIYNKAVQMGQSAGHVAVSARDSNRFTVSINIEPESKATFLLTYEELLERRNNQYELVLNIHPGQVVKNLNIEVMVNESRPLKFVKTPSLRSGNEISKNSDSLDPSSEIQIINSTSAVVKFTPSVEQQKGFAKELGSKENEGLAGQFVVQYDVDRDPQHGEVLLKDGYFVHFFAPDDLEPLPKHIIFILDTSGSMYGTKLKQLKDAMSSILDELKEADTFHIVEFNSNVYVWNIDSETRSEVKIHNEKEPFEELLGHELPAALPATKEAIAKGKSVIEKLQDTGLTNMLSSLETALHLVKVELKKGSKHNQPLIVFLTDGDPTMGITNTEEITKIITGMNNEKDHVPIFSLSFGNGADKNFLRKLSLQNLGFSRHIYEAADASLQLREFYKQISSPLLSNIEFEYTDVAEVSKKNFPIYFKGSELIVSGKYDEGTALKPMICRIKYMNHKGPESVVSVTETPISSLERLWAYLTIKQKLEEREIAENKRQLTKEALELALKYSFVTDVSSLIVVKPNETSAVDTEDASKPMTFHPMGRSGGFNGPFLRSGMPAPPSPNSPTSGVSSYNYMSAGPGGSIPMNSVAYAKSGRGGPPAQSASVKSTDNDLIRATSGRPVPLPSNEPTSTTAGYSYVLSAPSTPIMDALPWLKNVLSPNNTIHILGGEYILTRNEYHRPAPDCPVTPLNNTESGFCETLSHCQDVHKYLTDFQTYEKYACIVKNKYVGVCCPRSKPIPV